MYHLLSFVNFCGSNDRSDSGSSSGCDSGSWSDGCSYSGSSSIAQFEPCFLGSTISIFKGGSEYNFYLKVGIKISSKDGYQRGGDEN